MIVLSHVIKSCKCIDHFVFFSFWNLLNLIMIFLEDWSTLYMSSFPTKKLTYPNISPILISLILIHIPRSFHLQLTTIKTPNLIYSQAILLINVLNISHDRSVFLVWTHTKQIQWLNIPLLSHPSTTCKLNPLLFHKPIMLKHGEKLCLMSFMTW